MVTALARARAIAETVVDPELPMLTLADLGVLRNVAEHDGQVVVTITPTYTGCPAIDAMRDDLVRAMDAGGFDNVEVRMALHPAWTTADISADGLRKLADAGIAPPSPAPPRADGPVPLTLGPTARRVRCPYCGSTHTDEISHFGATACKALRRCRACNEPFEHFKELS